jgi:hypothetical protein
MNTWYAEGLRWIASLFISAAERVEANNPDINDAFDSDAYLADIRNRVFTRYY